MLECPHRLHSSEIIYNSKAMEGQAAVRKMVDVLNSKSIGASVGNFVYTVALESYVSFTPKYCPNSTHGCWYFLNKILTLFF